MKNIVNVGCVPIGGEFIPVQTMLSRKTIFVEENLQEIKMLKDVGCDIVRIAISSDEDVSAFKAICSRSLLPIVADIQYSHELAIKAVEAGASKIRINPSNIGTTAQVEKVCHCARANGIPIRVGVNLGSLDSQIENKYGRTFEALARSCVKCADMVENFGVHDIVLSVKASNVRDTILACRLLDKMSSHPQHIGLTEAGTRDGGIVKNSMALGTLLFDGIGNTLRVSLSAPPVEEVIAGNRILRALGLQEGVELISCPTCSRCDYDLYSLAKEVEDLTFGIKKHIKIAVMGCAVNGIGESKDADIGIVGGKDKFVIFKDKKIVANVAKDEYKEVFKKYLSEVISEKTTT